MEISFEKAKRLLAEIEHLKFVDDKNYWKYCGLYEDVAWQIYFSIILGCETVEFGDILCERLAKYKILKLKGDDNNETN